MSAGQGLNTDAVAANLNVEYASQGLNYSASDIANWIDQVGDGVVGKNRSSVEDATPSTAYTSAPYVVGPGDNGATFSVTGGTLLVNGVAASGTSVVAVTGQSLAISLVAGSGSISRISAYLDRGGQAVAQFTVAVPGLALLAGYPTLSGATDATGNAARFSSPYALAADNIGNIYVADGGNSTIREISPAGVVTTLAGSAGVTGVADGSGTSARFNVPSGLAVDGSGNIYVADTDNHTIRLIKGGVVSTLAGTAGVPGSTDGTGTAASFDDPGGVAVDASGNVYVADTNNDTIRKITPAGVVSTFAGSAGSAGSTNGAGAAARFSQPEGIAVDNVGNVYVADTGNHTVRKITPAGVVSTLAGNASTSGSTDGTGSAALFDLPWGIATAPGGIVYVNDFGNSVASPSFGNFTVRKITPSGSVSTVLGRAGLAAYQLGALPGLLEQNVGLAVSPSGLLVLTAGNAVLEASLSGGSGGAASLAESVLHSFAGGTGDGSGPATDLIEDANGNLYGATTSGGANNLGTVFKITPAGVETVLHSFAGGTADGSAPEALIHDASGNLYGTTASGGLNNAGTVFKITPAGAETVVYSFAAGSGPGALIEDASGNLYGTTTSGGANSAGTVFKITSVGAESVLYSFAGGTVDGSGPGALIEDASGNLYGTTYRGGLNNAGTVFKITPAGVETVLYSFAGGTVDGSGPGALIEDASGNLYGTTYKGGANNAGTAFKVTATGAETVLHSFAGGTADGSGPGGRLIEDASGNLYGTTTAGGVGICTGLSTGCGTVFKLIL